MGELRYLLKKIDLMWFSSVLRIRDILFSSDPYLWLTDPAPVTAIFVIDLQDSIKELYFFQIFLLLFERKCTSFFKDKKS